MKTFVSAKIHGIRVTAKSVDYHGSIGIDADLMQKAGLDPYEQVHLVNLRNGARWITYAIPDRPGKFSLNGGSARLGELGDRCLVIAYRLSDRPFCAPVLFCDAENRLTERQTYAIAPSDPDGTIADLAPRDPTR